MNTTRIVFFYWKYCQDFASQCNFINKKSYLQITREQKGNKRSKDYTVVTNKKQYVLVNSSFCTNAEEHRLWIKSSRNWTSEAHSKDFPIPLLPNVPSSNEENFQKTLLTELNASQNHRLKKVQIRILSNYVDIMPWLLCLTHC